MAEDKYALTDEEHKKIVALAKMEGLTESDITCLALRQYLRIHFKIY